MIVTWRRKIDKQIARMPLLEQKKFKLLVNDIKNKGAIQPGWRNFSSLVKNKYHCHLSLSWVACWELKDNKIEVEVYYVGSRESAPY